MCNNFDKGAIKQAIVHRALWEYTTFQPSTVLRTGEQELRKEILESYQDVLAKMVHTEDGSHAVREFIAQGMAETCFSLCLASHPFMNPIQDRKHILKNLKPRVVAMCSDNEAQLILFAVFDVLEPAATLNSLRSQSFLTSPHLRPPFENLRRAVTFSSTITETLHACIALLEETDAIRAGTSKKDNALHATEIIQAVSEGLLPWIAEHGVEVARDPGGSLVVCDIMLGADGDKSAASDMLLRVLAAPSPSKDPSASHPIPLLHMAPMRKTVLQGGHYSKATQSVEREPLLSPSAFAARFLQLVGKDVAVAMACGDSAFVVAALCEQLATGEDEERQLLKAWFDKSVRKFLGWRAEGCLSY